MDPADPTIVDRIVTRMEIKAESVTVRATDLFKWKPPR